MIMIRFNTRTALALGGCALFLQLSSALAQTSANASAPAGRSFLVTPRVTTTLTATDNATLSTVGKQSDVFAQVSPGISVVSRGGRIRGSLDYALNSFLYAQVSEKNQVQHALSAQLVTEAVENWAFLDLKAAVSQQVISAFGQQSFNPGGDTSNQTQVASYALSPYVKGRLLGETDYELRVRFAASHTESLPASDTHSTSTLFRLNGATAWSTLGWSGEFTRQLDDFSASPQTRMDHFRVNLIYSLTPQLSVSALGGYESNNYLQSGQRSGGTYGAGLNWLPTNRTKFSAEREHRLFGDTYSVSMEHRMRRVVLRYSAGRDLSSAANPSNSTVVSAYELYFSQFASLEPDPVRRRNLVNSFLSANGISPSSTVGGGFLNSGISSEQRQELSLGWAGLRSSVTFFANRTDSRRLNSLSPVSGDLATLSDVQQTAFSVNLAHRLTPISTLSLLLSEQKTRGDSGRQLTTLRQVNLGWSSKLSPLATVSLGARHAVFDNATQPYDETAVTGTLNLQF
jgi:uncharacterized protein (PEP-CTERM system associated)